MIDRTCLPEGSTVLLTGASGFIGSSIALELLEAGFQVRGAGRGDGSRLKWLQEKFDRTYGKGRFQTVQIDDYTNVEQLERAVQGVTGVVHAATPTAIDADDDHDFYVNSVVEATTGLMKVAARYAGIKSFVYTSSRIAAYNHTGQKDEKLVVTADTWLDGIVALSKATQKGDPMKAILAYASSKVEGEKAAWRFVEENKPSYTFNTVLPDYVLGKVVNPLPGYYTTNTFLNEFFNGDFSPESSFFKFAGPAPSLYVDVLDVARAHVVALTASDVSRERIFAATDGFTVEEIAQAIRKVHPHHRLPDYSAATTGHSDITVPNQRFKDLLKKYYGVAPIALDTAVARNILDA